MTKQELIEQMDWHIEEAEADEGLVAEGRPEYQASADQHRADAADLARQISAFDRRPLPTFAQLNGIGDGPVWHPDRDGR